jgi:hypothetical protein
MKGHWQSKETRLLINDAHACLIDVYSGKHQSIKIEKDTNNEANMHGGQVFSCYGICYILVASILA